MAASAEDVDVLFVRTTAGAGGLVEEERQESTGAELKARLADGYTALFCAERAPAVAAAAAALEQAPRLCWLRWLYLAGCATAANVYTAG